MIRSPEALTISVILPAYHSEATIAAALESVLAQTRPADQIIVVDSSADEATAGAVRPCLDRITFIRSAARLYPHEARNRGAREATGRLLVFTDPDIAARPDWLANLEAAQQRHGGVIIGAVDCLGRRWRDVGVHLCKFDKWLPGGRGGPLDIGPSVNFALLRADFDRVGGFPADPMLGDTTLSWALNEAGARLWFEPRAVVAHRHDQGLAALFRERFRRGREFGRVRVNTGGWTMNRVLFWLLFSVLPLRIVKLMLRRVVNTGRAGWFGWLALTWPVVLLGELGWLWGESAAYIRVLRSRRRTSA